VSGRFVAQRRDDVEETAIRPVVIPPVLADQLDGHD
jgi:hypothetical protein